MKLSEFKLRLIQGANVLIDDYFGSNALSDKLLNSTLKILVKQNQHKLNGILDIFADENGEIDENIIIEEYSKVLGDRGAVLDLRNFINNDLIRNMLPNKALVIKIDDLERIFMNNNMMT